MVICNSYIPNSMDVYKCSFGLIFCLLISLPGTSDEIEPSIGRFDFTNGQTKVEIPFYTFNNQVILSIRVNDKVSLNFILDSGSPQAVFFDRKLATDIGVGLGRKIQFSGIGNTNIVTAYRARGVRLSMPGVVGNMMGMAVLNSDNMDMKRFDIHGVIGYQLFARFAVKIDYTQRILTLMEPFIYDDSHFQTMDLEIINTKPYIHSKLYLENSRQVPLKLMIDTGSAFGLSLITESHPDIQFPRKSKKLKLGTGLGGEIKGVRGQSTIKFGTQLVADTETFYMSPKQFSKKGLQQEKMGSIGGAVLNKYVVIIDYINSKFLLREDPNQGYLTQNAEG